MRARPLADGSVERWDPGHGWWVEVTPLKGSTVDPPAARQAGLVFIEGRDRIEAGHTDLRRRYEDVARMVDERPDALDGLPGDFSLLRFRPDGGVTLVRACAGIAPLYLVTTDALAVIGTNLGEVAAARGAGARLDPLVAAMWGCQHRDTPDGRSLVADIRSIERATYVALHPDGRTNEGIYWQPRVEHVRRPTDQVAQERAENFRSILLSSLDRSLATDGNILALSGGIDSTALASLTAGTLGRSMTSLTIYPERPDLLAREHSYIDPLVERFGFEPVGVEVGAGSRRGLVRRSPSVVSAFIDPMLAALVPMLADASVNVYFNGQFADEIVGGSYTLPDWIDATPPWLLPVRFGRFLNGPKDILRWGRQHLVEARGTFRISHFPDLDTFIIHPDVRAEYREWRERKAREVRLDRLANRYLALRAGIDGWVNHAWEVVTPAGVRPLHPFFTREMLEFAFQSHPDELVGPGTKKLIRRALVNDVPKHNLFRMDKGLWNYFLHDTLEDWEERLPAELEPIISPTLWPQPPQQISYVQAIRLETILVLSRSLAESQRMRA